MSPRAIRAKGAQYQAGVAPSLYGFGKEGSTVKCVIIALSFIAVGAVASLVQGGAGWTVTTWSIIGLLVSAPVIYRRTARPFA